MPISRAAAPRHTALGASPVCPFGAWSQGATRTQVQGAQVGVAAISRSGKPGYQRGRKVGSSIRSTRRASAQRRCISASRSSPGRRDMRPAPRGPHGRGELPGGRRRQAAMGLDQRGDRLRDRGVGRAVAQILRSS
jgi:hypothetical protein